MAADVGAGPDPPREPEDRRRSAGRRRASGRSRAGGGRVGLLSSLRRGRGSAQGRGAGRLCGGEGPPLSRPLRSSPTRGRAAGLGRCSPGPGPPSPGLSASPSHDRSPLASAQTFPETPPERFQPKQQGPGRRGRRWEGARWQRHPGICSQPRGALGSSPPRRPGPARWGRRRSPGTQRHPGTSAGAAGTIASSV